MENSIAQPVHYTESTEIQTSFSFAPFIHFLKSQLKDSNETKGRFFRHIIKKFEAKPALLQPFSDESLLYENKELVDLFRATIFPMVSEEKNDLFAISIPFLFRIFYSSEGFRKIFLTSEGTLYIPENIDHEQIRQDKIRFIYKFILHKFYGINLSMTDDFVYPIPDQKTGIIRVYRIIIDKRFIEITNTGELPQLEKDIICPHSNTIINFERLKEILPLSNFHLEGFAIWDVKDITVEASINEIKNTVLGMQNMPDAEYVSRMENAIRAISGLATIRSGLLPVLRLNNKFVLDEELHHDSLLAQAFFSSGEDAEVFSRAMETYLKQAEPVFLMEIDEESIIQFPFAPLLKKAGFNCYLLYPVRNESGVAGLLELACNDSRELDYNLLSRLEPTLPLLAQALDYKSELFNAKIEKVIRDKFTSVQQAVEWKFNEVAWDFLRKKRKQKNTQPADVLFDEVHPLYGAIDVRNSSIERNHAMRQDFTEQLDLTGQLLSKVLKILPLPLTEELIYKNNALLTGIGDTLMTEQEMAINDFLDQEIHPLFQHLHNSHESLRPLIMEYLRKTDEKDGHLYHYRRQFDTSMEMINSLVSNLIDEERQKIEGSFPHFFEKYKTDGIEYNMYVGQSLAPDHVFDTVYLKNMRLWQLSSMAAITRATESLVPELPVKLHTTQLILVHSNPIAISFRRDERRFDVDGAYNIRYEIVKKRIDKVHLKDSEERLTQPGKIAIVYSNNRDGEEWLRYIEFLQHKKILLNDTEQLALEDLQGVSGLRGIRVGVNLLPDC